MIDSHCHLNFHSFKDDYDEVIKRAIEAGVHTIINTGTQVSSSRWAVELAEKYENLYAIVGIHPHHADKLASPHPNPLPRGEGTVIDLPLLLGEGRGEVEKDWLKQLEQLANHPKVIGIGEIGIDYYNYKSNGIVDPLLQEKIFVKQLYLAHKLKLPLQIHSRTDEARKKVISILKENKHLLLQDVPGMFHCMAGSLESLKAVLSLGFYVGFDGNSMYEGLPPDEPLELKKLIDYTPIDRIVIETDSPYLAPPPYRNKRNEPIYAIIIGQFIAEQKNISLEKLVDQTDQNVYTVFTRLHL